MKVKILTIIGSWLLLMATSFYLGLVIGQHYTALKYLSEIDRIQKQCAETVASVQAPYRWNSTNETATLEQTIAYLTHARNLHQEWADNLGEPGYPLDAYSGGREVQLRMARDYDRILSFLNILWETNP